MSESGSNPESKAIVSKQSNALATSSEEVVERFIEVQVKEISVREQEIGLRKQQDQNQFQYALAALEAQKEDRKDERKFRGQIVTRVVGAICLIVALVVAIILAALLMGYPNVALEIFKAFIFSVVGALGGYGLGKSGPKKKTEQNDS